jgi:hypothetical protein
MTSPLCRFILLLSLLAGAVIPAANPVSAQASSKATLFALQTEHFPEITAYLDVRNAQGNFIRGLTNNQVSIIEDGNPVKVEKIEPLEPGAQFIIAVNPGRSLSIRDGQGTSRYDLLVDFLSGWAETRSETSDDFSLLFDQGPEILHTANALEISRELAAYEDDFRDDDPDLDVLTRALEILNEEGAEPGRGRAILFVTSPLDAHFSMGLDTIASQAVQRGIRISIWFVSSTDYFSSRSYGLLQELADRTGGQIFAYSGMENLPDPEQYLTPLREVYRITYISAISTGGEHNVYLEIDHQGEKILSSSQNYFMEIDPPNPILISPPTKISRVATYQGTSMELEWSPDSEPINILVEYPDGFPRQLVASFLYVNGVIVAENVQEPFDKFNWDLRQYWESGSQMISVQVVDSLGLSGLSAEVPVEIIVELPRHNPWLFFLRHGPQLVLIAVVFSGTVLLLVLVLGGKIKPRVFEHRHNAQARSRFSSRKSYPPTFSSEPLTQPVRGLDQKEENPRRITQWINRLHWPQRQATDGAYAFLTRLSEDGKAGVGRPIPITDQEIRIGRDPYKANMVLNDPSLDGFHTSICRVDGKYRLSDAGTIAGTWVNYSPVSTEGSLLEHGDLVHIGRVGFRFTLREPGQSRKPSVVSKEPDR